MLWGNKKKKKSPGLQVENSIFTSVINASRAHMGRVGITLTTWNRCPFRQVRAHAIPVVKYL